MTHTICDLLRNQANAIEGAKRLKSLKYQQNSLDSWFVSSFQSLALSVYNKSISY